MVKKISGPYVYWEFHESIGYSGIQLSGLPVFIVVKGYKLLRKTEFHITFINLEEIAKIIDSSNVQKTQKEIMDEAKEFLTANKLNRFKLIHEFRFVQKDIRKSLIVMCELPGADKFFDLLSKKYGKELPAQPFHITLYALQPDKGIGILSGKELSQISEVVDLPELKNLKPA